jgi:hypothetical protein
MLAVPLGRVNASSCASIMARKWDWNLVRFHWNLLTDSMNWTFNYYRHFWKYCLGNKTVIVGGNESLRTRQADAGGLLATNTLYSISILIWNRFTAVVLVFYIVLLTTLLIRRNRPWRRPTCNLIVVFSLITALFRTKTSISFSKLGSWLGQSSLTRISVIWK